MWYEDSLKNFVQVPLFISIEMIKYKVELADTEFIQVEEIYALSASFLDN